MRRFNNGVDPLFVRRDAERRKLKKSVANPNLNRVTGSLSAQSDVESPRILAEQAGEIGIVAGYSSTSAGAQARIQYSPELDSCQARFAGAATLAVCLMRAGISYDQVLTRGAEVEE